MAIATVVKEKIIVSEALQLAASTVVAKCFKGTASKDWQNSVGFFRDQIANGESPDAIGESLRIALKKQGVNNGSVRAYVSMLKTYTKAGHALTDGIKQPVITKQIAADKEAAKVEKGEGEGEEKAELTDRQKLLAELATAVSGLSDDQLGTLLLAAWEMNPAKSEEAEVETIDEEEAEAIAAAA